MCVLTACLPSCIPKRYVLCFLMFFGLALNYILTFTLGLLITAMVRPVQQSMQSDTTDYDHYCPYSKETASNSSVVNHDKHKGEFNWDEYTQGIVLSSFFWGYIVSLIPAGMIAERVGGKYPFASSVFVPSLGSLLTPVVARHGGPWALVVIRVINGLGQGFAYPSVNELLSKWAPLEERGRLGSTVYAGAYFGNVVFMLVSGLVLNWTDGDWAAVFYLYGGSGLVWLLVWQCLGYSRPEDHPGMSPSEKQYLEKYSASVDIKKKLPPTPWKAILSSKPCWASALAVLGANWGKFSTLTNLSKYMTSVLHFSVVQTGLWSSLFYVFMCVGAFMASMAVDILTVKKITSVTTTRRIFVTTYLLGSAVGIMGASFASCHHTLFLALMVFTIWLMGSSGAGVGLSCVDLSPNYAGSVTAFGNTVGALAGMIPPYIMGLVVTDNTIQEWRYVFSITATVMIITNVVFIFFSSGDIQSWNSPSSPDDETNPRSAKLEL